MMKKIGLAVIMMTFSPVTSVYAVKVFSLYKAEIPVVSQSSDVKEQAVKEGFLQVLIKVSGDPQIDKNPVIRTSLKKAEYYVHEYSYALETPDSSEYLLRVNYEPSDIQRLLEKAGMGYWGENRPLILVWLVFRDKHNSDYIIGDEQPGGVFYHMKQESKKYGLPIIFPVMDVSELNQISPRDVATVSIDTLETAAKRYSPEALLVGEMVESAQGMQSKWQLMFKDTQWNWEIDRPSTGAVISSVINQVTQALFSYDVKATTHA